MTENRDLLRQSERSPVALGIFFFICFFGSLAMEHPTEEEKAGGKREDTRAPETSNRHSRPTVFWIRGWGCVNAGHLAVYLHIAREQIDQPRFAEWTDVIGCLRPCGGWVVFSFSFVFLYFIRRGGCIYY